MVRDHKPGSVCLVMFGKAPFEMGKGWFYNQNKTTIDLNLAFWEGHERIAHDLPGAQPPGRLPSEVKILIKETP